MQMAKTQKNKATSGHLGMLKVISYLTAHALSTLFCNVCGGFGMQLVALS